MNKKIAFLLILFMVGSWCVFADDDDYHEETEEEGMSKGLIILIAVGVVLVIGGGIAIYLAASGDKEGAQKVMNSLSMEEQGNEKTNLITNIMNNPIIKHATVDVNKDKKTFVGLKFAW